jgi:ribosomal protein S4
MLPPDRPKNRFKERFLSIRLTRLYFITFQDHQFRAMFKRASKLDGSMIQNYYYLLECRSLMILYRTLFAPTPFDAIKLIKNGFLFFDGDQIHSLHAPLIVGKFIHLAIELRFRVQCYLAIRSKGNAVLFNVPKFMFVSFYFIMAILLRLPQKKDFIYPITIDVQRITGYY